MLPFPFDYFNLINNGVTQMTKMNEIKLPEIILPDGANIVLPQLSSSTELKPDFIPTLHELNKSMDNIHVGRHEGIEGEEEARMTILTNFILGRNCVVIEGQRSTGKTALIDITSTFLPNPILLTSSSEKADIYDADTLDNASHFVIPETNKVSNNTQEMLKDFGEGKSAIYKTLNDARQPVRYEIKPKGFISSKADENTQLFSDEFLSRITVVRTNSSIDMNTRVMNKQAQKEENPYAIQEIDLNKIKQIQDYIKHLPSIKEFTFIHPAATIVRKAIPPLFTDCRRDRLKYSRNTFGITLFHKYDRMITYKFNQKQMYVTPVDMWYNHIIFGRILLESALKCSSIEKKIIEVLNESRKINKPRLIPKEIHSALHRNNLTPSTITVKKYLKNLAKNGYLVQNEDTKPHTFEVADFFKRGLAVIHLNWSEIVEHCKQKVTSTFPDMAQEYISRFCESSGLIVIHPFTGEKINILEWEANIIKVDNLKTQPQQTLDLDLKEEGEVEVKEETIKTVETEIIDIKPEPKLEPEPKPKSKSPKV